MSLLAGVSYSHFVTFWTYIHSLTRTLINVRNSGRIQDGTLPLQMQSLKLSLLMSVRRIVAVAASMSASQFCGFGFESQTFPLACVFSRRLPQLLKHARLNEDSKSQVRSSRAPVQQI